MALTKYKLGNLLQFLDNRNVDLLYGSDDVRGVNNLKELMPTKADISGRDLRKFQIVNPGEFVFNHRTSRNGSKFSIAYNDTEKPVICTEDYVVFRVTEEAQRCILSARWLYIFFKRAEFDRYVITNSWGSSTEFFNWDDVCDIEIELPPLDIQQKYVDVYQAMLANQQSYEQGLEDLKVVFDSILDKEKHKAKMIAVGELLTEIDRRNDDGAIDDVKGININKQFMPTVANTTNVNLRRYKVVEKEQIAYSGMQTGRDKCIRIALQNSGQPIIVSPAYTVFEVNKNCVLPEYFMMWFSRSESDRRGWFMSDSSIRSNLDLDRFYETQIPVPSIDKQRAIVDIYKTYVERKSIGNRLRERIKNICPILIKGSLDEGRV